MIIATTEAAAAAIDPTLLSLVSIFGGVLITVIAGFIGAGIQSRREHTKWLRERRYEAFVSMTVILRRWRAVHSQAEKQSVADDIPSGLAAQMTAVVDDLPGATSPLSVLGPDEVHKAASEFTVALHGRDSVATKAAERKLQSTMRKALNIKG